MNAGKSPALILEHIPIFNLGLYAPQNRSGYHFLYSKQDLQFGEHTQFGLRLDSAMLRDGVTHMISGFPSNTKSISFLVGDLPET
jgi:urease beta subunit